MRSYCLPWNPVMVPDAAAIGTSVALARTGGAGAGPRPMCRVDCGCLPRLRPARVERRVEVDEREAPVGQGGQHVEVVRVDDAVGLVGWHGSSLPARCYRRRDDARTVAL